MHSLCRLVAAVFLLVPASVSHATLAINEVMASNTNTIQNENGVYADWVELYNTGTEAVDLTNWGLSDNESTPFKWRFGAVTIQPGEFLLIWADSLNLPTITATNMLHTSFAISKGGETVVLTRPDTNRVDQLPATAMLDNQSVGRQPDGTGGWHFFAVSTPGASNTTTGVPADLAPPAFTLAGGVYTSSVLVAITSSVPDGVVRYTLDGSEPTTNSPAFSTPIELTNRTGETNNWSMIPTNLSDPGAPYYEGWQAPLGEVFKLHTVRARTFKSGSLPSRTVTQSYLVDTNGTGRYRLPIISIATDPSNFFSDATGIYVPGSSGTNYMSDGSDWERPASVEMIETNGQVAFRFDAGIRINGNTTRTRPRKALRIYARNPSTLTYPLFPQKAVSHYDTFLLRNAGNDWGQGIFRDAFLQELAAPTGLDRQSARPAVVFIAGEYWGIHDIRDRQDEGYIANHYGLGPLDFVQLESGWEAEAPSRPIYDKGNTNLVQEYYDLLDFVNQQGVASSANYTTLLERIDLDNYLDYMATEIWSGNTDWPGNNMKVWRSATTNRAPDAPTGHDARWRWMLCDMDFGLGLDFFYVPGHDAFAQFDSIQHAAAANGVEFSNNTNATLFFRRLLENNRFRQSFVNRLSDHLNATFQTGRVLAELSNTVARLAPEMPEHVNRWRQPFSWSNDVARIASYATQRTPALWGHLQTFFSLGNRTTLTVRVNDAMRGWVQVNSLAIKPGTPGVGSPAYPWSGSYFPDYPVELTATAKPGYRFTAWRRLVSSTSVLLTTNLTLSIAVTNATDLRADFELDLSTAVPQPHTMADGPYSFTEWTNTEAAGTYPTNLIFEQTSVLDPGLATEMDAFWTLGYSLASSSRINGLGTNGVAFINTSGTNVGGGYLGSALLGLTTTGQTNIQVSWTGGTVAPNTRVQAIRLQYRVGASGSFADVLDASSQPVEYLRNAAAGHSTNLNPVALPAEAENQPYVQLRWKYYFVSGGSSARAQLRVDDILVTSERATFAPVADAGADHELTTAGGTVTLDASASYDSDGSITNYAWSQRSGPALTLTNHSVVTVAVPAQPTNTTYSLQVVVTDNDGLSATDTVNIVQIAEPLVSVYPTLFFRGTPNGWSTTPMVLVSNYTWEITVAFDSNGEFKFDVYGDWLQDFGDQYGQNIQIYDGAGTYRIRFQDQSLWYSVERLETPIANAGPNQTVGLAGGAVTLNGSASYDPDGSITSYQWTQYAGPTATLVNTTGAVATASLVARATPATNRFRLVVTDNEGYTATSVVWVIQGSGYSSAYSQMFLRGTANNWTNNQRMALVSNYVWEIRIEFGALANERFKFDASQNWTMDYGDNETNGTADAGGLDIRIEEGPGLYLIRFNDENLAYTLTKVTGGFISVDQTVSLSGTFNQWTTPTNLALVDDHLWSGVIPLFGPQSLKFVATGNWANAWGDLQDPESQSPVVGIAEAGAPSIVVTSALSGIYEVTFHAISGLYRLQRLATRAGTTDHLSNWEQAHGIDLQNLAARTNDADGDGLDALAEAQHNTDPDDADSDGDQQSDGDEVVAATNPNESASRFELLSGVGLNWPGAAGRTYRLESAQTLDSQDWQPLPGYEGLAGSNGTMQATPGTTSDWQHLRVRIIGANYPSP